MVRFEPRFAEVTSYPPGTTDNIYLPHPYYDHNRAVSLALFNDHRFAFFYWALWYKKNGQERSDLITLDWHQDLAPIDTIEELKAIDLDNTFELSFFTWARLNPLNDDHIKAAMYCNIIGDAYVVCKQDMEFSSCSEDEFVEDMFGNIHTCKKFRTIDGAYKHLKDSSVKNAFLDIDLDYFTIENISTNSDQKTTFIKDAEIRNIINPESDFMRWIFQHMNGFTIAFEPDFVGGFSKALRLYGVVERTLFTGSVLRDKTNWRHLV